MVTPRQYAEHIGKPYITVIKWIHANKLPGVKKYDTPSGPIYALPLDTPKPEPGQVGRPKTKTAPETAIKPKKRH